MKASGMNILTDDGRIVARLYITETVDSMEQFLAKEREACALARRMAAADDMLAALESTSMALAGYLPDHRNHITDTAIAKALAAIAKARGGA